MSQDSDSLSRVRKVLSRHKAFEGLKKPESASKSNPYLAFMREKRGELLAQDPTASRKKVMKAVSTAWNNLSPIEKKGYKELETPPQEVNPLGKKRESDEQSYEEPKKRPKVRQAVDAYEQPGYAYNSWQPDHGEMNLFEALGSALKAVANYFLVRPL